MKIDFALNDEQLLICHKTKPNHCSISNISRPYILLQIQGDSVISDTKVFYSDPKFYKECQQSAFWASVVLEFNLSLISLILLVSWQCSPSLYHILENIAIDSPSVLCSSMELGIYTKQWRSSNFANTTSKSVSSS